MKRRIAREYRAYNQIDSVDMSILLAELQGSDNGQMNCSSRQRESPSRSTADSNAHCLPISLAAVHSLPSLLDRSQHRVIRHSGLGSNECGLGLEVDVEGLDAYMSLVSGLLPSEV